MTPLSDPEETSPADRLYTRSECDVLIASERERCLAEVRGVLHAQIAALGGTTLLAADDVDRILAKLRQR